MKMKILFTTMAVTVLFLCSVQAAKQKSIEELKSLSVGGDTHAMVSLAERYERGEGVPKDFAEAVSWYIKAAEGGNPYAQDTVGWFYQNGEGVEKNVQKAISWYQKAVDQGNSNAEHNLAVLYDEGVDVPEDNAEAVRLYELASKQGHLKAQLNLGVMYQTGEEVPKDLKKAWEMINQVRLASQNKNVQVHGAACNALDEIKKEVEVDPRRVGRVSYPNWDVLEKNKIKK